MVVNTLDNWQKDAVRTLWNHEYPKSVALKTPQDLTDYLDKLEDQKHILAFDKNDVIIGWFFGFIREDERWFAIIVNSNKHRKGIGSVLLNQAKALFTELNGWVITDATYTKQDGTTYNSPLGFYLKHGFSVLDNETFDTEQMKTVKIQWTKT